jgi:hypothetical protein
MASANRSTGRPQTPPEPSKQERPRAFAFMQTGKGSSISLGDVTPSLVIAAIDAAINEGVLVSIGRTSDGGAIGVYLSYDGEREKAWAGNEDELEKLFEAIRDTYQ